MRFLRLVQSELIKSFKILRAYWIEIVFWVLSPLLWVIPLVFQGYALVGGLKSKSFANLSGTEAFIPFVLIGAIVSTYMFSSVWAMGNSLREENYFGTLEFIMTTPTPPWWILFAKAIFNAIISTIYVVAQIAICILIFGVRIALFKFLPALLFILLLVAGLYGIGLMAAGLTLLVKESHGILHALESVMYLFSPIRYPVRIHPVTYWVSRFIPLTYALIALRGIIMDIPFNFWKIVGLLLIVDSVFIPLGFVVFNRTYNTTRLKGTLGHY